MNPSFRLFEVPSIIRHRTYGPKAEHSYPIYSRAALLDIYIVFQMAFRLPPSVLVFSAFAALLVPSAIHAAGLDNNPGPELIFATKALAEESVVPANLPAIRTLGYYEPGTGGALYVYSGTAVPKFSPRGQPNIDRPAFQYIATKPDSLGHRAYYVIAEETPNVFQFGAKADAVPDGMSSDKGQKGAKAFDNTDSFNAALSYGKSVLVPGGRYWIEGTLKMLEDGTVLSGVGPGGNNTGGSELYFGSGTADCIQIGDGANELRWGKVTRLTINSRQRTGGNAIFAFFDNWLTLEELKIASPYNGILLFRGLGFMLRDLVISGIRAGDGTADVPSEIGYGIKLWGAPELYDKDTGKKVKRDGQVVYLENISFGSLKVETDPTNWTVGLWCAENAASVNGATVKNQNVRRAVYISRAAKIDPNNKLIVPDGYTAVPGTWTDTAGTKGAAGKVYTYGSPEYPSVPGQVPDLNGRFQDLTLFYLGGDFLGGEYVYDEEGTGVAIYNPHFMRSYQGNCVYMGPEAKDLSIYGGQVIGAFKHGFDMNGQKWQISGVQVYKPSLDTANRQAHKKLFSAIHVGATSVGGDILNCKIGNEPPGTKDRAGNTAQYGLDIAHGARGTWYNGNRFDGCIEANVHNEAGTETQAGTNYLGPAGE